MRSMGRQGHPADFYEDDEDPRAIRAAFDRGPKGVTARPYHAAMLQPVGAGTSAASAARFQIAGYQGMRATAATNG